MIPVTDPFGVTGDPAMPFLADALHPQTAIHRLREFATSPLTAIRVIRHKRGRRCLIEYDFGAVTLIGKARAKGIDHAALALTAALRRAGLDDASNVTVPEPVGAVSEFGLWLQRKVPGRRATGLLPQPGGRALARRIADAIHRLHGLSLPTAKAHTLSDELFVLDRQLFALAVERPELDRRLKNLAVACRRVADDIPESTPLGVHRDLYPDQVLVDGDRLYLLDFDLYCRSNPALDAGNFLGHLTEQAVRHPGDAGPLGDCKLAFEDRYASLCGEDTRQAVRGYAELTLARLIAVSHRLPERQAFTSRLLRLCEQRLELRRVRVPVGGNP